MFIVEQFQGNYLKRQKAIRELAKGVQRVSLVGVVIKAQSDVIQWK